ncbi:hypothetical protein SH591_07490 [Sphingomonas sp. LY54]|uniref:hypothetical protein n=1 Tax=Sphingomonas sp. LY54 TaxID=3095343 RepID=UPI002D784BB8|nr:hypothetical protein [Sphingomonas sp. LY54]WRP30005.1 hypothetical protein SH591_07490 [Sphingomonas sp. LY54]
MPPDQTISALLAAAGRSAEEDIQALARRAARAAWVERRIEDLRRAQREADAAWFRLLDGLPEDLDEDELDALPEPPKQAALAAIHAELDAVRYHDRWPEELYWSL